MNDAVKACCEKCEKKYGDKDTVYVNPDALRRTAARSDGTVRRSRAIRFLGLQKSRNPMKKWDANFILPDGKQKLVSFGAAGMRDFTLSPRRTQAERDEATKARRLYITRHSGMGEDWRNPLTAGALSRYILWEYPTIEEAEREYRRRFGLL
jgi:hypothetical protein